MPAGSEQLVVTYSVNTTGSRNFRTKLETSAFQQENNHNSNGSGAITKMRSPMRNLMFDTRVCRGFPNGNKPKPSEGFKENIVRDKPAKSKRRQQNAFVEGLPATPVPICERKHVDIQTDLYLQDLTDKISKYDMDTQTDPFIDLPQTPYFIPWKQGPDVATQIYENDLFDFDLEVEAMLEVLVGRTLEQSFMEVMEDHELSNLRNHQSRFEQLRIAELVSVQQMESSELRASQEKERRKAQERDRLAAEQRLAEQLEAERYAALYLTELAAEVYGALHKAGYFFDPVSQELETEFLPVLKRQMCNMLETMITARSALNYMVDETTVPEDDAPTSTTNNLLKMDLNSVNNSLSVSEVFQAIASVNNSLSVSEVFQVIATHVEAGQTVSELAEDTLVQVNPIILRLVENFPAPGEDNLENPL